jgi:hypothetical protein
MIGDSMIASVATDEENTLVRLLEKRWNTEAAHWEVMNFGVSSASTGQELVLYREVAARYDPDVVVCAFYVGNDLADNSYRLTRAPRIYFELDEHGALRRRPFTVASAARGGIGDWLDAHSRFYVWQKQALRELRGRARTWLGQPEAAHWIFARTEPPDVADAWTLTGKLLTTFASEVQANGGRFAVVMVPSAEQVYDDLWEGVRRQAGAPGRDFDRTHPEARLGAICREAGIPFVSLLPAFRARAHRATSTFEPEWLFHQGRWHLNDEGQRVATDEVERLLRTLR